MLDVLNLQVAISTETCLKYIIESNKFICNEDDGVIIKKVWYNESEEINEEIISEKIDEIIKVIGEI